MVAVGSVPALFERGSRLLDSPGKGDRLHQVARAERLQQVRGRAAVDSTPREPEFRGWEASGLGLPWARRLTVGARLTIWHLDAPAAHLIASGGIRSAWLGHVPHPVAPSVSF
jgi:hypothetical protein